jgi:hypothetical protein
MPQKQRPATDPQKYSVSVRCPSSSITSTRTIKMAEENDDSPLPMWGADDGGG